MIKLGVTGNIAAGKTLVESFLKDEGVPTVDADRIVHDLLENDQSTIQQVSDIFIKSGLDVKNEKGSISREKVGKIVFKDKEKLKELENILHPRVNDKIQEFFSNNQDKKIAAAIVPLIYEAKMEKMFDYIVLVITNKSVQIKRLIDRSKLTEEEALLRINAQIPQDEKIKKADFVIDNSYDAENTKGQLKEILNKLNSLV